MKKLLSYLLFALLLGAMASACKSRDRCPGVGYSAPSVSERV